MAAGGPGVDWEVEPPARGSRAGAWGRPRATLRVSSEAGGDEELRVPVSVGRRLESERSSGAPSPRSRAELLHYVRELSRSCGRARVEELVGRRDWSAAELARRLVEEGWTSAVADELVARARECGLVDDARFGGAFARAKVAAGWGRLRIERELSRRGIDAASIEGWPEEFVGEGGELARARELASRRRLTGRNDYQKIVRFLCGRGFAAGVASEAARDALREAGE